MKEQSMLYPYERKQAGGQDVRPIASNGLYK